MSLAKTNAYVNPLDNISHALELARLGYYIHPLRPNTKRPLTDHGHLDATRDEQTILQWWATWPDANIGIALKPSGLLVIAPDCEKRRDDFIKRNHRTKTAETTHIQTRSGPGHEHWYYQRPANCPVIRICKSGDFDLLTEGYIVAAPSVVPRDDGTHGQYTLLNDLRAVTDLPEAPSWAIAMLREESTRRDARRDAVEQLAGGAEDEPPVRLFGAALEWWDGARQASDRSGTLWAIGKELYRAGATVSTIAAALAERDMTLHAKHPDGPKYAGRPDAAERYLETALKVAAAEEAKTAPAMIVIDQPETCGNDPDCWRRVAEQDQRIAALEEENHRLRERIEHVEQLHSLTMAVQRNSQLKAARATSIGVTFLYDSAASRDMLTEDGYMLTSRAAIGEAAGCSESAVTRHLDCLERAGIIKRRVKRVLQDQRVDPETGEILEDAKPKSQLEIRLTHPSRETLERLATINPSDEPAWGGERKKRVECPDHPNAAVNIYRVHECAECEHELERQLVDRIAPDIRPDDEITPIDPKQTWQLKAQDAPSNATAPSERQPSVDSYLGDASCTFRPSQYVTAAGNEPRGLWAGNGDGADL